MRRRVQVGLLTFALGVVATSGLPDIEYVFGQPLPPASSERPKTEAGPGGGAGPSQRPRSPRRSFRRAQRGQPMNHRAMRRAGFSP